MTQLHNKYTESINSVITQYILTCTPCPHILIIMITDADIKKLKQVFPTRDELKDFARKDDLKEMEQRMTKTIVNAIMEVYEILGKHDQEFKPLKREQRGQRVAIGDHEMRIKHLEYPTL